MVRFLVLLILLIPSASYAINYGEALEGLGEFFDSVTNFFDTGLIDTLSQFAAYLTIKISTIYFEMKIFLIGFMWETAKQILINLDISGHIESYWSQLDSSLIGHFSVLKIPEAINMVTTAIVTRFTMSFWGIK